MLTSSPPASPAVPRPKNNNKTKAASVATPQTSHTLNKSHRLLRPLKSKLVSLRNFYESNPSTKRVNSIWSGKVWPPTSRIPAKFYGGRRKRTRSGNVTNNNEEEERPKALWEEAQLTDVLALNFAKESVAHASISQMFQTLHSSYRIFIQQLQSTCSTDTLGQIATYELGSWTYLYEKQSSSQNNGTPSAAGDPVITLDDVLLEYLPPTHPHLPLLLGYTTALIKDFREVIQPLLPSLIFLTQSVSRRATLDLVHCLFEIVGSGWDDFSLCMAISNQIGRGDEYLLWLSRNMTMHFISTDGIGHLLRLGRDHTLLPAVTLSIIQLCVPRKRTSLEEHLEMMLTELILLVCTYSIQSNSTNQLIQLASALSPQHTPLPSLSLLLHLTIKSACPDHSLTPLHPLVKRNLTFSPLRQLLHPSTLKSLITDLFSDPILAPLAMSISRDWKDHIDYDDESDNFESTSEFLERVEREYLTMTEGVQWRFEDVLAEWIGVWPDGRQIGSSRIPRTRRITIPEDDYDEAEDEEAVEEAEEEFAGSLIKRAVPRSGLLIETPVPKRGVDPKTERRTVLERLFKLSNIGRTSNGMTHEDAGGSFLERLGLGQVPLGTDSQHDTAPYDDDKETSRHRKRRITLSDLDETSIYKDSSSEAHSTRNVTRKHGKRRRFDDSDAESEDGSVYEDSYDDDDDDDLENQGLQADWDIEPPTSDVDELSITIDPNRSALHGITLNKTTRRYSRRSSIRTPNKLLVRESSPVLMDEVSEDELAI